MKTAIFTGTFDPPTLGHFEIIKRASALFDKLYVAVSKDTKKHPHALPLKTRMDLLSAITTDLNNVEVIEFTGLAVDCAKSMKAAVIVRGIRNGTDLDFESQMAAANHQMTGVETVVLLASPQYSHLSSTLIREIASEGRRLHGFVPDAIEEAVFHHLSKKS